jgi:hypothetical protein
MKLIQTKTLATGAASLEFTSLPQDGTDLLVLVSANSSNPDNSLVISFNGTTSGFTERNLLGLGAGSGISQTSSLSGHQITGTRNETANTFANGAIYIPNYTSSNYKSISSDAVSEANQTGSYQFFVAGIWANTSAITSLAVYVREGVNLVAGSTVSVYKITKGSDGIVTTS